MHSMPRLLDSIPVSSVTSGEMLSYCELLNSCPSVITAAYA